jgi:hypothetical protein
MAKQAKTLAAAERRVMTFVKAGEITAAEAARMLGVHRSTVGKWGKALGVDPGAARDAYVKFLADAVRKAARDDQIMTEREIDRLLAQRRLSLQRARA